tara:strand:+ start:1982 stop:2590 length:609 start_codon:yes stop_codon:yes gene_type:complete
MSGPALGVISQAIKLWLKSVCSQLEHLDLKLQGSLWRLLQGHLAGATVHAKGVVFQDLAIDQVELNSEPIDLDVGALLKGQPLQLRQSFAVKGWVRFSESGLTRCLQNPALADFSSELSSVLLGGQPLQRFEIHPGKVLLHSTAADPVACKCVLEAGELSLRYQHRTLVVPMDPAITLEQLELHSAQLTLRGRSMVSPEAAG